MECHANPHVINFILKVLLYLYYFIIKLVLPQLALLIIDHSAVGAAFLRHHQTAYYAPGEEADGQNDTACCVIFPQEANPAAGTVSPSSNNSGLCDHHCLL